MPRPPRRRRLSGGPGASPPSPRPAVILGALPPRDKPVHVEGDHEIDRRILAPWPEALPLDLDPPFVRYLGDAVGVELAVAPVVERDAADERDEIEWRRLELLVAPDRGDRGGEAGVVGLRVDNRAASRAEHALPAGRAQQLLRADAADRRVEDLDRVQRRQPRVRRAGDRSTPGRGTRGSRWRTRRRRSPRRSPPSARRARAAASGWTRL